ncbi:MAG: hypothetical protein ACOCUH_00170 [Bacteriovoracia bacterium]
MGKQRLIKGAGAKGFKENYWNHNYSNPNLMDGVMNTAQHVNYLKATFGLEYIDISTVVDLGFGLGYLLEAILKEFIPHTAEGIEPSAYAFEKIGQRDIPPVNSMEVSLRQMDLVSWCKQKKNVCEVFDLGICTSVLQYLTEEEIEFVLPVLAQRIKYLYLSVPTDKELKRQIEEFELNDTFAFKRSRSFYQKVMKKHFTVVSCCLLESKVHFNEQDSSFTNLVFRF